MQHLISRASRVALVITSAALYACVDEPTPTSPLPDLGPRFAPGDVYTVTNTNDNGLGSLRWALSFTTGGEIIRFDPSLAGQTITLDSSLTLRNHGATIEGPVNKGITISGGGRVRILDLSHTGFFTFRNVTLRDGKAPPNGSGGVAANSGNLAFENSTITNNEADGASALIISSLRLVNSTVTGNRSTASPGPGHPAVVVLSNLDIINSTVAFNSGGGIDGDGSGSRLVMRNSIVSNNANGKNCGDFTVSRTFEGQNISDDDSCGGPTGSLIGNPLLAPLAYNGGPNDTHALLVGSPAINAGLLCSLPGDQRYVQRDAQCDLGAFEFIDFTTVALTIGPSPTVNRNTGWAVVTGTVQCSRNETFDVMVRLAQNPKAGVVQAVGTTPVTCSTSTTPWSVALAPSTGSFTIGNAQALAQTVNAEPWVTPASMTKTVKLFASHK